MSGIGTLSERTLHRAVKEYLEPDVRCQEVPVAGIVADLFRDGEVIEVQTGSVTPLVKKLLGLPPMPVTIVLPIIREKRICTVDENGVLLRCRKSPKRGTVYDCYYQLPRLLPLLGREKLTLRLLLLDADEYRTEAPNARVGRRDCRRLDRVPTAFREDHSYRFPEGFGGLLPPELPEVFTREMLRQATGLSPRAVSGGLAALQKCGAVERCGREGRACLYRRVVSGNGR